MAGLAPKGELSRYDGSEIAADELRSILNSQTLFSQSNWLVLNEASQNKSVWTALATLLPEVDSETQLILCDTKPDKRTKTYKVLQKTAKIIDCSSWKASQQKLAESWLLEQARRRDIELDINLVQDMVRRAIRPSESDDKEVIDQQLLDNALSQLAVLEQPISADIVATILPPSLHENVFELLSAAVEGRSETVRSMSAHLKTSHDGYMALGLLASQALTMAGLILGAGRSVETIAGDIGAHPFVARQLAPSLSDLQPSDAKRIIDSLSLADERLKQGRGEAWQLIEQALIEIASGK